MSKSNTFQKITNFLSNALNFITGNKNNKQKISKKTTNILITQYNYKVHNNPNHNWTNTDQLTIQEKQYAEQFKFHDDTYFDENNLN